jgi:tetratricopeptide (TPR) repeat protein
MIRIIQISIVLLVSACSIDLPLEDQVSGDDAIDIPEAAREVLNAAYASYSHNLLDYSFLTDDFMPTYLIGKDQSMRKLYNWNAYELALFSNGIWQSHYHTIAQINTVLNAEQHMIIKDEKDEEKWETIKGQAYALKAMLYLELLYLYADQQSARGIILKDQVKLEYLQRSSVNKCEEEIDRLLEKAKGLLETKAKNVHYLSYDACLILQARLYLWQEEYQKAISVSEELIEKNGLIEGEISKSYASLWGNEKSGEKIFAKNNFTYVLGPYGDRFDGDIIIVSSELAYEENDIRKDFSILPARMKKNGHFEPVIRPLLGKYRSTYGDETPKDVNCIRLAEAYFLAAESYMHLLQKEKAVKHLNVLLASRGAALADENSSENDLWMKLRLEKRKEFLGEGLRYFDLKRWRMDVNRYKVDSEAINFSIKADDYRWVLPIPKSEIKRNKEIKQNPEWEIIIINIK